MHTAHTEQRYKTLYDPLLSIDPWNSLSHPDPPRSVDAVYVAGNAVANVAYFLALRFLFLHPPPATYRYSWYMYRLRQLIVLGLGLMTGANLLTETQVAYYPQNTRRYYRWQFNCLQTQPLAKSNRAYRHAQAKVTGFQTSSYPARNTFWKRVAAEESSQNNTRSADYCTNSFNVFEKIQKEECMAAAIYAAYRRAITKSQIKP